MNRTGRRGGTVSEKVVEIEAEAARPTIRATGGVRVTLLPASVRAGARGAAEGALSPVSCIPRRALRRGPSSPARSRGGTAIGSGVFLGVHDAIVCLVDLVHPLGGVRIVGVQIGVVLARLPAVCLLHLVLRGIPRHTEYAIRVHCHCVPYSPSSSSAALAAAGVISSSSWAASPNFPQYCPHNPAYSTLRRM